MCAAAGWHPTVFLGQQVSNVDEHVAPATYVRCKLREPTELGLGHVCDMLLRSQNYVAWPPSLEVQTGRCPTTVQGRTRYLPYNPQLPPPARR